MAKQTTAVEIDWPCSHHSGDSDIRQQLAAGGDEGPLLVLPAGRSAGSGHLAPAAVFSNVDWYFASLSDDEENFPGERWAGLVRGTGKENGERAVAALQRVAKIIAPIKKTRKRPSLYGRDVAVRLPDGALTKPSDYDGQIVVVNDREGFD